MKCVITRTNTLHPVLSIRNHSIRNSKAIPECLFPGRPWRKEARKERERSEKGVRKD